MPNIIRPVEFQPTENGEVNAFNLPEIYDYSHFQSHRQSHQLTATKSHCVSSFDKTYKIKHAENTVLLVVGLKGRTGFSIENKHDQIYVEQGDVWLFTPQGQNLVRHQAAGKSSSMFVMALQLDLKVKFYAELAQELSAGLKLRANGNYFNKIDKEFSPSLALQTAMLEPSQNMGQRLKNEGRVLEIFGQVLDQLIGSENGNVNREDKIFKQVQVRLLDDLMNPPSLNKLAQEVGINHVKLNKMFSHQTGMTIFQYYRHVRMQRAAEALRATDHSITSIAFEHGFNSSSHFSNAFAKMYNLSPKQYRFLL
ncbi:MAG: hypothetical protein COB24_09390 [Hyphomicrobiales bacterium]|nr:MAG: hypothetical protein COB24_09390 [Hyphomicrobiales bacterium]